jgi:RNA polymerase sigma-70 factor (ECF subfamily)
VEDVVQECFLRLHRAWGESPQPPVQRVGPWLFAVAHNLTMDLIRRQRYAPAAQGDLAQEAEADEELSTLGRITQSEAAAAALTALDRLPAEQKQVVLMKVLQGLTFRQIAKATNVSLSNVNYRLNQALGTLARQLKQSGHL